MSVFEKVYTYEWYDGPRQGVADYLGEPHIFESEWSDGEDLTADTLLVPIDRHLFVLALEDWDIWRRWETAFHRGEAANETHPALPADRKRHEELKQLLDGRLRVDRTKALRKSAQFQVRSDPSWSGYGWQPLEVLWSDPP